MGGGGMLGGRGRGNLIVRSFCLKNIAVTRTRWRWHIKRSLSLLVVPCLSQTDRHEYASDAAVLNSSALPSHATAKWSAALHNV